MVTRGSYLWRLTRKPARERSHALTLPASSVASCFGGTWSRWIARTVVCSLQPGLRFDDPFNFDASGLIVKSAGPPYHDLVVTHVVDSLPAAESGIRKDDKILEFTPSPPPP